MRQKTLKETVSFEGIGIHTGEKTRVLLHPEEENKGLRFYRKGVSIPAHYRYVVNTSHSTDLGRDGVVVRTVEHLLASLHLLGITNLTVEVLGEELPILDGSGYLYYRELKNQVKNQSATVEPFFVSRPVTVKLNGRFIKAEPCSCLEVSYEGEFKNFLGRQKYTFKGEDPEEIVFARTFCFDWEIEHIKKRGLGKGGSLSNTLVLGKERVYNAGGMRYSEEPVRHKVFDLVGDLYLLGRPVRGKFFSYKGGHALNYQLVKELAEGSELEKCGEQGYKGQQ